MRRAVITGLGPVTATGIGKEPFWNGLLSETSAIRPLTAFNASPYRAQTSGEIPGFDPTRFFPPHRLKRLDRYAQFAVASALLALEDAGIDWSPDRPNPSIGVSYGTALGGIANAEHQHARFVESGPRSVHKTLALQVFGGSAHSNIAIECGFQGPGTTNSNSCASGTIAIGEAARYIRDNMADIMVAGAAEAPLCPLTYGAFDMIRTMSAAEAPRSCRPFDRARDGFVMGEGAASLIIEEYEHARNRGARIYAEVTGYSIGNDAHHMTTPRPDGTNVTKVINDALTAARLNPDQIDYINAHASSTQMNDSNECECIKRVFDGHAARIPVSGLKAYFAHPLGATGAIETVACALSMERGWLPPTLHLENPDPSCNLDLLPNHGRESKPRHILTNSFGFGGINSCLILSQA